MGQAVAGDHPTINASPCTPRQRMLNAYRGWWSDVRPVAPEFWCFVPARILGVDMITLERDVPLWQALQATFKHYGTEGWCATSPTRPNPDVQTEEAVTRLGEGRFQARTTTWTRRGTLTSTRVLDRSQPSWEVERPVKDLDLDMGAWLETAFPPIELHDYRDARAALRAVGEDYLLEVAVGVMFSDFFLAPQGLQQGLMALHDRSEMCSRLQARYLEYMAAETRAICENIPDAPLFVACGWACASLIGPALWRRWDKPVVQAIVAEAHRHGRLVHMHYHGRCMESLADLVETGVDCICPFERAPGGDVTDLSLVRRILGGKVAMNGNVHTVETLIRGRPEDVQREVREILDAFRGEPRLIVGTGDQVGPGTPDENIHAMVEAARQPAA